MLEAIAQIIKDSGAQHMNLTVRVNGDKATVIANTTLQPTTSKESEKALQLRAALAQPIVIKGNIGELDISFNETLAQYADTFVEAAQTHSSLIDVKAKIEQASKASSTKKTKAQQASSKNNTSEIEVEKDSQCTTPSTIEPSQESFESDEATSL